MAVLTNKSIASTYKSVLSIGATTESALTSSIQQLTDGLGNGSPLSMSTTQIQFNTGSNTFKFPTTRGTSGQILKLADANGTLGWVADASGDVTKTGTIALNTIAVWNDNADQLRSDTTMSINTNHTISLLQPNSVPTDVSSYNIGGGNIANVTGQNNTGFGQANMQRVTTGSGNTAFGAIVLDQLTIGSNNVGLGKGSLFSCTEGDANTGVGGGSLADVTTGDNNTALGEGTGADITTTSGNTFIGKDSGRQGTGSNNTYVGFNSGSSLVGGDNNVIIGSNTGSTISTTSNNIIISDGSGNNRIQVNSGGNVGIGTTPTGYYLGADNLVVKQASGEGGITIVTADNTNGALYFADGTTGDEAYRGGIYYDHANDKLHLTTAATSRFNISSGGLVSTGDLKVDGSFNSNGNATMYINGAAAVDPSWIYWQQGSNLRWLSGLEGSLTDFYFLSYGANGNGISRLILKENGNVGIGTSPANGKLEIKTTSAINYTPTSYIDNTSIRLVTGGTAATNVTTGISMAVGGDAEAYIGVVQNSSGKGDIVFQSHVTGGTYSEKMRITSGGVVDVVSTLQSGGNQRFGGGAAHGNSSSPGITTKATTTSGVYWDGSGGGGWGGGNFTTNNSDRNMKTNIIPMDINALNVIGSLETKYFNWTEKSNRGDTTIRQAGIIAQDLKELMPEGVFGTEWDDEDEDTNGLSLNSNATTALFIKAIQEQQTIIEDLKSRIETLEG